MTFSLSADERTRMTDLLSRQLGIAVGKGCELERGLRSAARELGLNSVEDLARLLEGAGGLSPRVLNAFAVSFTVGETYFFRDARLFLALEQEVLPCLLERARREGRALRIWSAGCSSGEELYSIAIVLDRLSAGFTRGVMLMGTDVNPQAIRRAQEGVYGEWSFRGAPEWLKQEYFESSGRREFRLHDRIRAMATFRQMNLISLASDGGATEPWDLILCRNVLMYFMPEQRVRVIRSLGRILRDSGFLITAPGEASLARDHGFASKEIRGTVMLGRSSSAGMTCGDAEVQPRYRVSRGKPEPLLEERVSGVPELLPATNPAVAEASARHEEPDSGAPEMLNPISQYRHGLLLEEEEEIDQALAAFRRALFLDPAFVMARYSQANLLRRIGRLREAVGELDIALTELKNLPGSQVLEGADGLTAARLVRIIQASRSLWKEAGQ